MAFPTVHIFDLDGTTIDSFHRVAPCLTSTGDLDLQKYRNFACVHELIMNDDLLPLAGYMRTLMQQGKPVVICTARKMANSDYVFLRKNKMKSSFICSRDQLFKRFPSDQAKLFYGMKDADYKRQWLQYLQGMYPLHNMIIYDDHAGVLEMAQQFGITALDAKALNNISNASYKTGFMDALDYFEAEADELIQDVINELSS